MRRQRVADQISRSGANAVLIAPQFAVDAADSSAGRFWEPGAFGRFMGEAAQALAKLHGGPKSIRTFASAPVIFVAYSGGYLAAASCAVNGGINKRLRGVVLPSLRASLGAAGAIAVSSLLFALSHDFYRMPFTFVVGVGLGVLRVRSGSLTPSVCAHASLNTITFLTAWALDDSLRAMDDPRPALGGALLLAGLAASVLLLRWSAGQAPTSGPARASR